MPKSPEMLCTIIIPKQGVCICSFACGDIADLPKIHHVHCCFIFCNRMTSNCANLTLSCVFPALFQRQRSWQGQDGWPAEVKERRDRDEADLDTSDWPTCLLCVYPLFCCVGLHVNCHDIKTINKSSHPLCCLSANYTGCLLLCYSIQHAVHNTFTQKLKHPGSTQ